MGVHLPQEELQKQLVEVEKQLKIGDRYRHYKNHHTYRIHSIALREEDDMPSVNYQDENNGIIFNRKVDIFLEQIPDENDKMVDRFEYIGGDK